MTPSAQLKKRVQQKIEQYKQGLITKPELDRALDLGIEDLQGGNKMKKATERRRQHKSKRKVIICL